MDQQIKNVCFNHHCFEVELAKSPEEITQGLMSRESLDPDKGMLFVFSQEGRYSFWMKNTLIPLDIIWVNKKREVVFISENTLPCGESFCPRIDPGQDAKYVLEVNAGLSTQIGLVVGSKLIFSK